MSFRDEVPGTSRLLRSGLPGLNLSMLSLYIIIFARISLVPYPKLSFPGDKKMKFISRRT
jgi:hypothetical protein